MNKILVVGHPSVNLERLEVKLNQQGFRPAVSSRRENLSAKKISAVICNAYGLMPITLPRKEEDFQQLEPGTVWNNLLLDLLLGNVDKKLWYWVDPESIYLMEYWASIEPNMLFLLAYDEPQRVLVDAINKNNKPSDREAVKNLLDNWVAYNGALLRFFYRNPQRCFLINVQRAESDWPNCSIQLQSLLDKEPKDENDNFLSGSDGDKTRSDSNNLQQFNVAEHYLLSKIVAEHSACFQLYSELQAVSNFPSEISIGKYATAAEAWIGLVEKNEHYNFSSQLERENELMLEELHKVQEEFESLYLENLRLQGKPLPLAASGNLGAADRIKNQLSYRLGSVMIRCSRSFTGWLVMPVVLAAEVRSFRRDLAIRTTERLPPVHSYNDAYEAERVKRHLSYRLGSVMVKYSKNPAVWPILPFYFIREIRQFRRDQKKDK